MCQMVVKSGDKIEIDFINSDPKHIEKFNKKYGVNVDEEKLNELFVEGHQVAIDYIHRELAKVGQKASNIVGVLNKKLMKSDIDCDVYSYIRIGILPFHPKTISNANLTNNDNERIGKLFSKDTIVRKGKKVG